ARGTGANNCTAERANRRTLLGGGARSQGKRGGNDNQELMHEILQELIVLLMFSQNFGSGRLQENLNQS
ncbi:hypothetical protein, partial [Devosia sp.]|uniref:hypothetical protein n=1 Tax=Devosia sp. TaxID=1871048 RepID=UPI001AC4D439